MTTSLFFSKRYTHVRVYSFKGSLAYYRELVKSFADFLSINILKCSFVFQFCTLKLHFKNTRKLFLSLRKICYAVNKEKDLENFFQNKQKNPWKSFDFHGFLVEATGFEGGHETLKAFIYKAFRVFIPHCSPKLIFIFPNVIKALIWVNKRNYELLFFWKT